MLILLVLGVYCNNNVTLSSSAVTTGNPALTVSNTAIIILNQFTNRAFSIPFFVYGVANYTGIENNLVKVDSVTPTARDQFRVVFRVEDGRKKSGYAAVYTLEAGIGANDTRLAELGLNQITFFGLMDPTFPKVKVDTDDSFTTQEIALISMVSVFGFFLLTGLALFGCLCLLSLFKLI